MDTLQAIRTLRVIRAYRDEPVAEADVRAIADTGRKTGSSKNTQRWEFVTIRERSTLERLGEVGHFASHMPSAGAAIALIVPRPDPDHARSILWDLGRAAQSMALAAWAMGIGSCPVTVYDFDLARRLLGLPEDRQCEYVLALGHPADPDDLARAPQAGGRRSYADVVHEERW
ncbi:nitroreductase family protein [soil metagenome]